MTKKIKIIAIGLIMAFLIVSIPSVQVHATDNPINISTITESIWGNAYQWLETNKPSWYTDYDYVLYKSSSTSTPYNITIVPKGQGKFFFANNEVDSPYFMDIDKWYANWTCTSTYGCYTYRFSSTGSYVSTQPYTTGTTNYDISTNWVGIIYSNWAVYTYQSYYSGTASTIKVWLNPGSFGIVPFPSSYLPDYGTQTLEEELNQKLIDANWGTANFLRDGINSIWSSAQTIMNATKDAITNGWQGLIDAFDVGWFEGILYAFGVPVSASSNFFQWFTDLTPSWISQPLSFINGVFGAIFNLVPYILYRIYSFVVLVGTQIGTGVINLIINLPSAINILFNYLPAPLNSIFIASFTVIASSTVIKFAWYIASFGGKS